MLNAALLCVGQVRHLSVAETSHLADRFRMSSNCTRAMVLEALRARVTLYYRLTKMPLEEFLDRVDAR